MNFTALAERRQGLRFICSRQQPLFYCRQIPLRAVRKDNPLNYSFLSCKIVFHGDLVGTAGKANHQIIAATHDNCVVCQQAVTKTQDISVTFSGAPAIFINNVLTITGVKQIGVILVTAIKVIVSGAACQDIAARPAVQRVITRIAVQNVVTFCTIQIIIATCGMDFTALAVRGYRLRLIRASPVHELLQHPGLVPDGAIGEGKLFHLVAFVRKIVPDRHAVGSALKTNDQIIGVSLNQRIPCTQSFAKTQQVIVLARALSDNVMTIARVKQIDIAFVTTVKDVITCATGQDIAASVVTEDIITGITEKGVVAVAPFQRVIPASGMNFTALIKRRQGLRFVRARQHHRFDV